MNSTTMIPPSSSLLSSSVDSVDGHPAQIGIVDEDDNIIDPRNQSDYTDYYDDDNNDEDEEEMISLGLSSVTEGGGSLRESEDDATAVVVEVGGNQKSIYPTTPAPQHHHATAGTLPPRHRGGSIDVGRDNYNGGGVGGVGIGGVKETTLHRRTPGPPSSSSLANAQSDRHRRTPGPSRAKTPIMSGGGGNRTIPTTTTLTGVVGKTPHKSNMLTSLSLVTPLSKPLHHHHDVGNNSGINGILDTPIINNAAAGSGGGGSGHGRRTPGYDHERRLYTPAHFTLAKNVDLHMDNIRPDAFSPATIRMTDSLEKILTDDDDFLVSKHRAMQQQQQQQQFNDRGAFRRIQSLGESSADDEIDEITGQINNSSMEGDDDEDEDEAEISQINEGLDENDDDDDAAAPYVDGGKTDTTSIVRPKPLNFDRASRLTTTTLSSSSSVSSGGAFRSTTMPRHQHSIPRNARGGSPYLGIGGMQHQSQQGYYQQQQQGYFGGMGRGGDGMMGPSHPPYPPSNMYEHPPHQYSHTQPQLQQYSPTHQHQHHMSQNFRHPSPLGFEPLLPMGLVSPLTLPTEYSQGHGNNFEYHPHANAGGVGWDPYAQQGGDDHWSRGGPSRVQQQQQSHVGMPHHHVAGHTSPEFAFHEMSGAVSPFTLQFPSFPSPTQQSNHYPRQNHQYHHHQSVAPAATRPQTKFKENQRPRGSTSPFQTTSPTKSFYTGEVDQGGPGLNNSSSLEKEGWFHPLDQKNAQSIHSNAHKEVPIGMGAVMAKMRMQEQQKEHALKQPRDRSTLPHIDVSRTNVNYYQGHHGVNESEDAKQSRGEFVVIESQLERQAFKEFGKQFRQKENESLIAARDYALACLSESNRDIFLPPATHWRVHLELADVAKRSNQTSIARSHYLQACALQPRASQGWLEHSKLEEESGNLRKCSIILQEGLKQCETNENLLIRAVKFYERMGDLDQARQLLSRLKYLSIDKSWKTMLEGGLLEARAGRYSMAREVLKFLTHNVPWYGPLYLAHTKLERDYGSPVEAYSIVEKGLKELPRYGPLYFQAFRLLEKEDLSRKEFHLPRTMEMISRADSISRELLWKVHLEAAQMHERAAELAVEDNPTQLDLKAALQATRRSYAKAIALCPSNLSWKIWLVSGRTELSCGNTKGTRDLFFRAYDSVSEKGRSTVLLECARLEEYCGDLSLSRAILCKAREQFGKSDWKVWLSSINLECRCGLRERAIAFAQEALNIHRGTGRLWAALIQLCHDDGESYQMKVLKLALQAVPKSGEVWCEGARIHLNPFSPTFDLPAASRHLSYAARFTPQYGDSFLEQLRLLMIDQWLIPLATPFVKSMQDAFPSSELEDAYKFIVEHTKETADIVKIQLKEDKNSVMMDVLDTSELELRCSSADPNYGHLWFQFRKSPIDTAREVIAQARLEMAKSIIDYAHLYIAAMVRRAGILLLIHCESDKSGLPHPNSESWDVVVDRRLRSAPLLDEILIESDAGSTLFITGCADSNRSWDKLSLAEKRKILFGSDSLIN